MRRIKKALCGNSVGVHAKSAHFHDYPWHLRNYDLQTPSATVAEVEVTAKLTSSSESSVSGCDTDFMTPAC